LRTSYSKHGVAERHKRTFRGAEAMYTVKPARAAGEVALQPESIGHRQN